MRKLGVCLPFKGIWILERLVQINEVSKTLCVPVTKLSADFRFLIKEF